MNERIRELAVQAGHRYYPSSNSGPLRVEYLTPELEKFAELIVRECQHRVEKYINECGEVASMPDTVIMKHFGIKE